MRQKVFSIVSKIPKGKVATYKQIAKLASTSPGSEKFHRTSPGGESCHRINPRAVGRILNTNEKLIEIPCHRIVMSDGRIGGYKGGVKRKIGLLRSEGVEIKGKLVDLKKSLWKNND